MAWQTKKLSEVSETKIKESLHNALGSLYKNDAFLLKHSAHERSITHKLAEYLQQQFLDWNVDCEYNLHGINTKKLPRECGYEYKELVYPDIIIHSRGENLNLLVIEAKLNKFTRVNGCDHVKLVEFTGQNGDYKYRFGVFIGFDGLNVPKIMWYQDGKVVKL